MGLSLFGACATPPPPPVPDPDPEIITETLVPITMSIINRAELTKESIGEIQFYVFGRIALEREETQLNRRVERRGNLVFEDVHIKEQILIKSQTPGVGVDLQFADDGVLFIISFDEQGTEYQLYFAKSYDDPDPYFYLSFDKSTNKIENGDEKGVLLYRDKEYKVKYSGEKPPFLVINLEQTDIEQPHTRILRGRTVAGSSNR
jgi:hypothetical protein